MRDDGPPAVLSPGDVAMGYTVVRQLGRGGFGTVYLATQEGQSYALKLVQLRRVGGRVEREISILLRLKHANVVGIRGFTYWPAVAPEFVLIAMEYVEGRQLGDWVKEENPSAREVALVSLDVARALAASHEAGVVHRDIKESNVMVRTAGGVAVVVDYGVGDYKGAPGVTQSGVPPGTPEYRPPEMWRFVRTAAGVRDTRYVPGPADDVWALGVVLYRLLTARWPFVEGSDAAFVDAVLFSTPAPPHVANRLVPEALSRLCMRLLEKEPAARPEASAVCLALEEVLAGAEGEAWTTPLCDTYGPHSATTEGGADKMLQWMKVPLRKLRRGKPPGPALAELPAEPGDRHLAMAPQPPPEPAVVSPEETRLPAAPTREEPDASRVVAESFVPEVRRRSPFSRLRKGRVLGAGLVCLALTSTALFLRPVSPPQEASGHRQEVAPSAKKPQAARAAAPTGPEATPAAVAPAAANPKVTATVTTTPKSDTPPSPPTPTKRAAKSVGATLAATALCGALACTGAQVRPPPESEPCPAGAEEGMKRLGMKIGRVAVGSFVQGEEKYITVRDGTAQVFLGTDAGATLSGRLIVADRVYVRLTRARTSKGSFPVCLEVQDGSNTRGLEIEGGGGDAGKARVFSVLTVKAVSEFE
ncbi:protein kinase [Myxococcus sp. K15C18031901]|uniref:serine/threonine-protein kinase n=1 Tax=Myxococcus dinghuensis TaxID=2906761 RepID=UPI0020A7C7C0|nr:serine/threonine-protein kinase [Myxococcus dinghuensis]MCP3105334.1 protein kinase [Myxococcus dinghuensis]